MDDIHDIKPQIVDNSLKIIIVIVVCLLLMFLAYVVFKKLQKVLRNLKKKKKKVFIDHKRQALRDLRKLTRKVRRAKQGEYHSLLKELSQIDRKFLGGFYRTHGLAMTKTEIYYNITEKFEYILQKCYQVEFARNNIDQKEIIKLINDSENLIKQCT
jgi:cell division protein YceG involved in septum cleavage